MTKLIHESVTMIPKVGTPCQIIRMSFIYFQAFLLCLPINNAAIGITITHAIAPNIIDTQF